MNNTEAFNHLLSLDLAQGQKYGAPTVNRTHLQ